MYVCAHRCCGRQNQDYEYCLELLEASDCEKKYCDIIIIKGMVIDEEFKALMLSCVIAV